jgi:cytochrome c-type biogenesis protein CcmH
VTALWIAAAALTVATLGLLLAPLLRRREPPPARAEFDLAVFRDQLAEVDRDLERGLLDTEQAEAARIEVERRMLAAADETALAPPEPRQRRGGLVFAFLAIVVVPTGAFGLYLSLGTPGIPDQPWAAGNTPAPVAAGAATMETAVASLVERLRANPDNADGWILLGRSYVTMDRYAEAAEAFRRALRLNGADPDLAAAYGEALVAAAGGQVTPNARQAFQSAFDAAPDNPKARYYLALHRAQQGDLNGALQGWVDLAAIAPADVPWLPIVHQQITRAAAELGIDPATIEPSPEARAAQTRAPAGEAAPRGPTRADMEAAAGMSAEDRDQMIRSMVERLAARLEDQPDDREGWLRLARAYEVLGEPDKARDALARAEALANP